MAITKNIALNDACVPQRESSAKQVLGMAQDIANLAEQLASATADRLSGFCRPEEAVPEQAKYLAETDIPPYFSELRHRLQTIRRSLHAIEDTLSRCEV